MAENSIISLGDLSKPATVLIEKISDAVGGLCKPHQIVRVAKAEAQAQIIAASAEIEIEDLKRRAVSRFLEEEARKQSNMEQITAKAILQLGEGARPEELEEDWIANFFERSRTVSDEEMQLLWASLLAGEANAPGSIAKKTINLVADLDKSDAVLFQQLCKFGVQIGARLVPVVFDVKSDIYTSNGITFLSLSHLESMGLIQFNSLSGFQQNSLPQHFAVHYYGRQLDIALPQGVSSLQLGHVLLTRAGDQLATICDATPIDGFVDFITSQWPVHTNDGL